MSTRSASSLARIVVLIALVAGAIIGGVDTNSTPSVSPTSSNTVDETEPVPTEVMIVDLSGDEPEEHLEEPTSEAAEPTAEALAERTEVATQEPQQTGRGDFPAPENPTGRSIVVERGPEDKQYVALTFDAGEGAGYTTEILDMLVQKNLRASFGITGEWARQNPDLVIRILDEGHLLFNHSESHLSWTGASPGTEPLTAEQRTSEVMDAHESIEEIADWNMQPFWRPPYGDLDADGQTLLAELGYGYTFWWTCDTLAWMGTTADEIAAYCASDTDRGGPGAIILMHVAQEQDYLALEELIADYDSAGYEFVTLDKMIGD